MGTDAFVLAFAFAGAPDGGDAERIVEKQRMLEELLALHQRVRAGDLPSDEELGAGRVSREQILAELDPDAALAVGIEPDAVRDRLAPGFVAELALLADQRARLDVGPLPQPSPLLTLVLDFEQEVRLAVDRRRQRLGLDSPFESGPLSQPLDSAATAAAEVRTEPVAPGPDAPVATADLRLLGIALHKAGRFADAHEAGKGVADEEGEAGLDLRHLRADCLLRVGRVAEAIEIWDAIAEGHAGSRHAAQAEFSLKVARAVSAYEAARKAAEDGR